MTTSCPREIRSVPNVSPLSIALPPALSVMHKALIRGFWASSRANFNRRVPPRSVITPRVLTNSTQVTNVRVS